MIEIDSMEDMQTMLQTREILKARAFRFNARFKFNKFVEACSTDSNLIVQKVFQLIDEIVLDKEKNEFFSCIKQGEEFFRARIIDARDFEDGSKGIRADSNGKLTGYNEINSREPMLGIGKAGRNNITGMSYLYIAKDEATACMEVKPQVGDLISLARFEVTKDLHIIDFSSDKQFDNTISDLYDMSMGEFFTELMFRFSIPVSDDREYRATQYISDYLRKTGVDGIKYRSFLSPGGINVTLFNSHPSNIRFCGSRILMYGHFQASFWDLNNEKSIISNDKRIRIDYDKESADSITSEIKQILRNRDKTSDQQ